MTTTVTTTAALGVLTPIAQYLWAAVLASGALGALIALGLKSLVAARPEYKPVIQTLDDYLSFAELSAVHLAEALGINTGIGGPAKLKVAVDDVLQTLKDAGYSPGIVNVARVTADVNAIAARVYPNKK
jgi:hypothetical protein